MKKNLTLLSNWAPSTRHDGPKTYTASAALAKNQLVKLVDATHVTPCGAADVPLGFVHDSVAAGEPVAIDEFGVGYATKFGTAAEDIAVGAFLVAAAEGEVRALPVTAGTYYVFGQAAESAKDGDTVEVRCYGPSKLVI